MVWMLGRMWLGHRVMLYSQPAVVEHRLMVIKLLH